MEQRVAQLKADLFKAISHPTRVRILELLRNGELCVCEIFEQLNVEQANTSQHLSVMKKQGVLESRKEGLRVIYRIKHPEIIEMMKSADKILEKQANEVMSTFSSISK